MSTPRKSEKVLFRREVLVDVEVDSGTAVFAPQDLDFEDGQTLAEWIVQQTEAGETPYETARDLDLLSKVSLYFQVVEHYTDGTSRCVERAEWKTGD